MWKTILRQVGSGLLVCGLANVIWPVAMAAFGVALMGPVHAKCDELITIDAGSLPVLVGLVGLTTPWAAFCLGLIAALVLRRWAHPVTTVLAAVVWLTIAAFTLDEVAAMYVVEGSAADERRWVTGSDPVTAFGTMADLILLSIPWSGIGVWLGYVAGSRRTASTDTDLEPAAGG